MAKQESLGNKKPARSGFVLLNFIKQTDEILPHI
jgi:hypothetical protein